MGYAKWLLNTHETYAKKVILLRLLDLIEAEAVQSDGPFLLYREAVVDGWDDIVEEGYRAGQFYADHYQVKHQYGDFKADVLMPIFDAAFKNLDSPPTLAVLEVAPERRSFTLCLPTDDVGVKVDQKTLSLADLRTLCLVCTPAAATQIATDKGKELTKGQRAWLETLAARFGGDFSRATKVIAQMRVDLWPESALNGALESRSRLLFEQDVLARSTLLDRVETAAPQGPLQALNLLPQVSDLGPKTLLNAVTVNAAKGKFWASHMGGQLSGEECSDHEFHVRKVWSRTSPAALRIGFGPGELRTVRSAEPDPLFRLMAHARVSPFSVHSPCEWYALARERLGCAIGCRKPHLSSILEPDAYQVLERTRRPVPEGASDDTAFATALHVAMDKIVEEEIGQRLQDSEREEPPKQQASTTRAKDVLFEKGALRLHRVLRAWWEPKHIKGRLRLGPQFVDTIVDVVRSLSRLLEAFPETTMEACKSSSVEDQSECIAWVGRTPVRALAIEMAAVPNDEGGYEPRNLEDSAEALLGRPGIILVPRMDVQDVAVPTNVTELGHNPMLSSPTPTGVLLNMSTLISRGQKGEHEVVSWVERQFQSQRGPAAKAAFEAARQDWKEQDDAA